MDSLKQIDQELDLISKEVGFTVTPINLDSEREKFMKSRTYEPQFQYVIPKVDYPSVLGRLESLKPDNSLMGKVFRKTIEHYKNLTGLNSRIGGVEFGMYAEKVFGNPDKRLVKNALALLKLKHQDPPRGKTLTSDEVVKRIKRAFKAYGFDWKVVQKEMVAKAAVRCRTQTLVIKKDMKFSERFVKRLIVHEIGTHVVRYENGLAQPYKLFSRGFPGYIMTEEGLAVVSEERAYCLDPSILKTYAGRVLAVDLARQQGFRATYKALREYFSPEEAFDLTVRAKRGLSDTSVAGAFTKDALYLKGYLSVKNYLRKGGNLSALYYGKIGLDDVETVERMRKKVSPRLLPMVRYIRFAKGQLTDMLRLLFDPRKFISRN